VIQIWLPLKKNAMIDKMAPNPSVEAILHALIPYKYVDHTHADAIVTMSNSKNGKKLIEDVFSNFLIISFFKLFDNFLCNAWIFIG